MKVKIGKLKYDAQKRPIVFIFDDLDKVDIRYSRTENIFIVYPKGHDTADISKLMSEVQKEVKNVQSKISKRSKNNTS